MKHLRTSLLLALGLVTAMPVVADTGVTVGVNPAGGGATVTVASEPSAPQTSPLRPFTLESAIQSAHAPVHEPTLLDELGRYRHESRFNFQGPEVLAYATKQLSLSGTSAFTRWSAVLYDNSGYPYFRKGLNDDMDINASAFGLNSQNGVYQYYTLDPSNKLTFASFGSMPTQPQRVSGEAFYKGHLYGILSEKGTVNQMHEAYGNLDIRVDFQGIWPFFWAFVKGVDYKPVDKLEDVQFDVNKSRAGFNHLHGWFYFSSMHYFNGIRGYYHGDMQCTFFCVRPENYRSKWQAMYAGTGQNGQDPEFVHGSFEMENFILNGLLFDWVGFLYAGLHTPFGDVARGYGPERYSPRQAVTVHVVGEKFRAQGSRFAALGREARASVVKAAGTIAATGTPSAEAVQLHVDYSSGSPVKRWADIRLQHSAPNGTYLSSVGGTAAKPHGGGRARFDGKVSGVYSAEVSVGNQGVATVSDTYVSDAVVVVTLDPTNPTFRGRVGYRIKVDNVGPITGNLSLRGGKWNSDTASFSDGMITCGGLCSITNTVNVAWSAMLMNFANSTVGIPDGLVGKFGALDVSYEDDIEELLVKFDVHGLFALNSRSYTTRGARSSMQTYFPADPASMVAGARGRYHRGDLVADLKGGSWNRYSIYNDQSPRVSRGPNGDFLHAGGTLHLVSPLWSWRTNDYGTCYCTMYLSGMVYGKGGAADATAFSSAWNQQPSTADKEYGWVAGLFLQDVLPEHWGKHGAIKMGMILDGTAPQVLPITGSATYSGDVNSYAIPSASTVASDMKAIKGMVDLNVEWNVTLPRLSGLLLLDGNYSGSLTSTFAVSLSGGEWSAADKRFTAGSVSCAGCKFATSTKGSWEGLFVETKAGEIVPGAFAAAYAIQSVAVLGQTNLNGLNGTWDMFGWYGTDSNFSRQLLDLPRKVVNLASNAGFASIYYNATSDQRAAAVTVAGKGNEGYSNTFHGSTVMKNAFGTIQTGFWTYTDDGTTEIGVLNDARDIWDPTLPVSGNATYQGNAGGFYVANNGRQKGVVSGDVSLKMKFKSNKVKAEGKMSLDFEGLNLGVTLNMDGKFKRSSGSGTLGCASECTLSENDGKWGGEFVETEVSRIDGTPPGAIIATYGLSELGIGNTKIDALGIFTAVKDL